MFQQSPLKDLGHLIDNPLLTLWVANNIAWDRLDSYDEAQARTDQLSMFINPEGWKEIDNKKSVSRQIESGEDPTEPKPKTAYSADILAKLKRKPGQDDTLDTIEPGGLEEEEDNATTRRIEGES